jgi:hypothetical protein
MHKMIAVGPKEVPYAVEVCTLANGKKNFLKHLTLTERLTYRRTHRKPGSFSPASQSKWVDKQRAPT